MGAAAQADALCPGRFSGCGELPLVQRVARAAFDWSSDLDERPSRAICKRQVNDV